MGTCRAHARSIHQRSVSNSSSTTWQVWSSRASDTDLQFYASTLAMTRGAANDRHETEAVHLSVGGTVHLAARVIKSVDAIGQPCFLERPLRPEIACLADHRRKNASKAIQCDHLTMLPARGSLRNTSEAVRLLEEDAFAVLEIAVRFIGLGVGAWGLSVRWLRAREVAGCSWISGMLREKFFGEGELRRSG